MIETSNIPAVERVESPDGAGSKFSLPACRLWWAKRCTVKLVVVVVGVGFRRSDAHFRVLFVVQVMLGPDWPLGVTRLLQWLETTDFEMSSTP